jgi:hypothetical protein
VDNAETSHDQELDDRKVDSRGALVIIIALVLGAVHFASGWTF